MRDPLSLRGKVLIGGFVGGVLLWFTVIRLFIR
jgi:hypothetical protein